MVRGGAADAAGARVPAVLQLQHLPSASEGGGARWQLLSAMAAVGGTGSRPDRTAGDAVVQRQVELRSKRTERVSVSTPWSTHTGKLAQTQHWVIGLRVQRHCGAALYGGGGDSSGLGGGDSSGLVLCRCNDGVVA